MHHPEILITTYQGAYLFKGGGERENIQLRQVLNREGFVADLYGPQSRPINCYDTVIHFSLLESSASILHQMRGHVRQMVLWPNFWITGTLDSATRDALQTLVDLFDVVVFRSRAERDHFQGFFDTSRLLSLLIAPGVSPEFFRAHKTQLFTEVYGLKNYAIWPGIIEPQKNQLGVIEALRGSGIPVVFTGGARDEAYLRACKAAADEAVLFLPEMPFLSDIHLSALTCSKVFLELPLDFPGLSAVEAAALGCHLVLTDSAWSREIFGSDATLVDPADAKAILSTVQSAMSANTLRTDRNRYASYRLPSAFSSLISHLRKQTCVEPRR